MSATSTSARMAAWLEQAWLARYLDRQLGDAETAWFEAYVLDKPELLGVIEADSRLRDALLTERPTAVGDDAANLASAAASSGDLPTVGTTFQRRLESNSSFWKTTTRPAWLSLAAALLVGIGVGGMALRTFAPRQGPGIVANPTSIVYYGATRGSESEMTRVEHENTQSSYVLVEIAVPPDAEDIALVLDASEQNLIASSDNFVSVLLAREIFSQVEHPHIRYKQNGGVVEKPITLPAATKEPKPAH